MPIKNYSTTPDNNNSAPPDGFPENMRPSDVNNSARQVMADIRSLAEDVEWFNWGDTVSRASNTTFKIASNVTSRYLAHRRIKCFDASTLYATVASSSYSAPDTTVTVTTDSGNLSASLSSVALSIITPTSVSIPSTIGRKGADVASATTTDIGAATGDFVDVTGTTTITGLGTIDAGVQRTVRFSGILTLTHNSTSLILPGGASITTAAGDTAIFRSLGSGNWRCISYQKASGLPIVSPSTDFNFSALTEDTSPAVSDDYLLSYDASASAPKKVLMNNFPKTTTHFDISGLSADASPDNTADYILSYDNSALAPKKVLMDNFPKTSTHFNFSSLTADASPDNAADYVLSYDDSASAPKKVLINNFPKTATHFDISGLTADASPDSAADYVLTYDNSATAAKKVLITNLGISSDWVKITSATASASANLTFTGLSSTYTQYCFVCTNILAATDNVGFYLRTSTNNGSSYDSSAGNYKYATVYFQPTTTVAGEGSSSATQILLSGGMGSGASEAGSWTIFVSGHAAATPARFHWTGGTEDQNPLCTGRFGLGYRNTTADIDAVQFLMSSGNIASGTITLYGIK